MSRTERNGFVDTVRRVAARLRRARTEGEPSMAWQLSQVGVLGWIVVTPTLVGLFAGRWLDRLLASGVFWTAALLFLGVSFGFWSAWRWMHQP